MADKKKESKGALARLMPNSEVVTIDGDEIRVPMDRGENQIHNMVMAAHLRHILNEQLKKYKADDIKFTPKELNELTMAAKNIATFSGEIYPERIASTDKSTGMKDAEKVDPAIDNLEFGKEKPIDVKST